MQARCVKPPLLLKNSLTLPRTPLPHSSHTPTQVDPTNGDMAIVSGAGKNILVNNVNIIAELERRKSEADSVQTELDEYKQQSVKDHEMLESKFNQAEEARKKAEEANRVAGSRRSSGASPCSGHC